MEEISNAKPKKSPYGDIPLPDFTLLPPEAQEVRKEILRKAETYNIRTSK
jgi:hypothetical protein